MPKLGYFFAENCTLVRKMLISGNLNEFSNQKAWLTLGNFDGYHLGHQALVEKLVEAAHADEALAGLITFWPHPKLVLNGETGPFYLSLEHEKKALLNQSKLDFVIQFPFTKEFAGQSANEFIAKLMKHIDIKSFVTGKDLTIGKNREGTIQSLKTLFESLEIKHITIPSLILEETVVSSQAVRNVLAKGDVALAKEFLGRNYAIDGIVTQGKQVGSKFGFPTANLSFDRLKYLPKIGVYATWAVVNHQRYAGVTNIGLRPTFGNALTPSIETLLLDFDGNIYGEQLKVFFVKRIRDEKKFEGVQSLKDQIMHDKDQARRLLENE